MVKGLSKDFENHWFNQGFRSVIGVDEVGRGSLAGPVVAAAVMINPETPVIPGVNDSKMLSAKARQSLQPNLRTSLYRWSIASVSPKVIDRVGILKATLLAMKYAIKKILPADLVLIDGLFTPTIKVAAPLTLLAVPHGDRQSYAIAAASIMAKVFRDRLMDRLDRQTPVYQWKRNKGYGTAHHLEALKKYGPSACHRRSYIDHLV